MNRRRLLAAFTLGLTLFAAPALAKDKQVLKVGAPKTVSGVIDMDPAHDPDNVLYLDLSNGGRVAMRLMPTWAPTHIERIKTLARQGFYNGAIFHRVIDGFMAQTGDPTGTGQGGSSLPDLKAEFNAMPHLRGSVSMARTENPDSANSQFFIVFYPRFALDRKYTNFGRVIAGMQYADTIERGEPPANPTKILQASLATDHKPQILPAPVTPPPSLIAPGLTTPIDTPAAAPKAPVKPVAKAKAKPKG